VKKFHWLIQLAAGIVLALLGVTLAFGTERGIALQKLEQHEHKFAALDASLAAQFAAVHGRLDTLTSEYMRGNRELHQFREQVLADLAVLKALMARIEQQRSPGENRLHRPTLASRIN